MDDVVSGCEPVFLCGPTASGKSAVALALAERLGGEIVSVDSMQVYRGLDVGTAKPTARERGRVRHHLIDILDLQESFDAARFVALAGPLAAGLVARGRCPVFCGGTALYFQAYLCGLDVVVAPDPALRARLEALPLEALVAELAQVDPDAPAQVDCANKRRVVRAIEAVRGSGRPLRELRRRREHPSRARPRVLVLRREPADLRARIECRVERMFADGLVEETRRLLDAGLRQNRTASQAIGYRQVVDHLDGRLSLEAVREQVRWKTWQYARRQMIWFRTQWESVWVDAGAQESAATIAERIAVSLHRA